MHPISLYLSESVWMAGVMIARVQSSSAAKFMCPIPRTTAITAPMFLLYVIYILISY